MCFICFTSKFRHRVLTSLLNNVSLIIVALYSDANIRNDGLKSIYAYDEIY